MPRELLMNQNIFLFFQNALESLYNKKKSFRKAFVKYLIETILAFNKHEDQGARA